MQGNRHGPTPLTVIGLVIRDRLSIWVPMPTIVYFHSIDTRVDGKCQMPNAECKIGANRNLSKDLESCILLKNIFKTYVYAMNFMYFPTHEMKIATVCRAQTNS